MNVGKLPTFYRTFKGIARVIVHVHNLLRPLRCVATAHIVSSSAVLMPADGNTSNSPNGGAAAEFLRDLVLKGHVILEHLPGDVMIADILTKAVARAIFIALMDLILNFVNNV